NLAWKLAALVQGWGGKNLLNSYSEERQPVAIRNTRAAQQMARRIGAEPVADEIESTTLKGEQARRKAAEFYMKFTETYGGSSFGTSKPRDLDQSATQLQSLDQAGVDQQPVEAARFGTTVAAVEQAVAALEHLLLLDEARIGRHSGRLLHDQRKVGRLDPLARRRQVQRPEVDRVDGVVGGEIGGIVHHDS